MILKIDVSIILPVYNAANYIINLLNSLNSQTLKDIEFLIIDDGSNDNTNEVIRDHLFKLQDKRFKLIEKENGGVSSARNLGIKLAKGKYLIFIDADDHISNNFVEEYYRTIFTSKNDIEFFTIERVSTTGKHLSNAAYLTKVNHIDVKPLTFIQLVTNFRAWAYPPSYISRRELWDNNFFPEKYSYEEDSVALFQILFKYDNLKIGLNRSCFYKYVQNNKNTVRRMGLPAYEQAIEISSYFVANVKNKYPENSKLIKNSYGFETLNILNYLREAVLQDNIDAYSKKRRLFLQNLRKSRFSRRMFIRKLPFFICIKLNATWLLKKLFIKFLQ